ncbi:hypothetical protein PROFUN_08192 [Planoprotostelium fungivorum]|uniref:Uncharacterized protein n=1 Tax=Planoprotostelium fungivorum TaxID=1890364 RepID=A0A2P6N652_9EUKA|nr:hypothetical protein PROFUN_13504 [Planoprotostelium fungivorum]PRP79431.1 hypothetical protein PROFUN_08192 [Planoprotostelium fungivorum]
MSGKGEVDGDAVWNRCKRDNSRYNDRAVLVVSVFTSPSNKWLPNNINTFNKKQVISSTRNIPFIFIVTFSSSSDTSVKDKEPDRKHVLS